MAQQENEKWLHLYRTVKRDIDKYMSEHPYALRNILNMKKMMRVDMFQATMQQLLDTSGGGTQEIGPMTSRAMLLSRVRRWFREPFHIIRVPVFPIPETFKNEAQHYFEDSAHTRHVLYRHYSYAGHEFHFFVIKTGNVFTHIDGYSPHTVYILGIVDNKTIEAIKLN
jgi:hypothetical protein